MQDFNPYQSPKADLGSEPIAPQGLAPLYLGINAAYALALISATFIVLLTDPASLIDTRTPLALLTFYAPLLCCAALRWGSSPLVRLTYGLQALHVLWLISRLISTPQGIGLFLTLTNLIAFITMMVQARRLAPSKERP